MSGKVDMPSPETFDDEYDDEAMEEQLAEKNATRSFANRLGIMIGLASMGVNAAVLIFMLVIFQEVAYISLVASIFAIVVALLVCKRQVFDMAPTHTLRYVHNKLRRKVHHLFLANNQLKEHVDDLEGKIKYLQDCENQLAALTKQQGANTDEFVSLVKENGKIVNQVTLAIKASATMQLMDVALDSDRDESSGFSDSEIDGMLLRLDNVKGIQVDEDRLRKALKQDGSLQGVLALLNFASEFAKKYPPGSGLQPKKGEELPVFTFTVIQ